MTLEALMQTSPLAAEAYHLCRLSRTSYKVAAKRLGVKQSVVRKRVKAALKHLDPGAAKAEAELNSRAALARVDERLSRYGRCKRCQLLWPCVCLPKSAAEYAEKMQASGHTYPPGCAL